MAYEKQRLYLYCKLKADPDVLLLVRVLLLAYVKCYFAGFSFEEYSSRSQYTRPFTLSPAFKSRLLPAVLRRQLLTRKTTTDKL
jgi:hypothetical protein